MTNRSEGVDSNSPKILIWQVLANVPAGRVVSYGQLAKLAGLPNHARYVGTVLKNLPKDTLLPWHRVVNSKGLIAFSPESQAFKEQKRRLQAEGVAVSDLGKITRSAFL